MCLILEVLRAHLLDNKIDVFCVNNEKPKVEKVQFQLTRGGSKTVNRDREGSTKMQHEIYLFPRFALYLFSSFLCMIEYHLLWKLLGLWKMLIN